MSNHLDKNKNCYYFVKTKKRMNDLMDDEDKMMSSDEVAAIIVKGIEQRKRSLIMTSQGKLTVFLNKIWPSWLDGLVYNHFTKEKNPLIK